MALTTSNVKQTSVSRFFEGLSAVPDKWRKVVDFRNTDTASLRIASLTGIGDVPTWDGGGATPDAGITAAAIDSTGASTLTYQGYAVQVKLNKYDIKDIPEITALTAQKLGQAVAEKYRKLAFTQLAGFTSTAAGFATADGKALAANDHTMTSGTRDNLLTTALSRTAIMAAIKQLRQFKNYQQQFTSFADGALLLVVPPELEQTAIEIIHSGFSGGVDSNASTMQMNAVSMFNIEIVVDPYMSDANDWVLMTADNANSPIKFWERSSPDFSLTEIKQDTRQLLMTVDFAVATANGPQPDGFIGGAVS